ncbi:hypothetical protein V6Z12_D13G166800 [Gossypium hirsutum]
MLVFFHFKFTSCNIYAPNQSNIIMKFARTTQDSKTKTSRFTYQTVAAQFSRQMPIVIEVDQVLRLPNSLVDPSWKLPHVNSTEALSSTPSVYPMHQVRFLSPL